MRLSRFDLNLLVVFEALMTERNVSRAADRLALSQSATSHALGRLRALLDDPLFVRTSAGMEPTARALAFDVPIRRALREMSHALEPAVFDPAAAETRFTIAVDNHAALVIATPLVRACAGIAPGVRLDIVPSGTLPVEAMLDRGDLDFAITAHAMDKQRFTSLVLVAEDDLRLVMRADHPSLGEALTLGALAELSRVEISSSGDDLSFLDRAFAEIGLAGIAVASVPYLALPSLLRITDHVAIVRRQIARVLVASGDVAARDLPVPSNRITSILSWHQRHSGHSAYVWLHALILRTVTALTAE